MTIPEDKNCHLIGFTHPSGDIHGEKMSYGKYGVLMALTKGKSFLNRFRTRLKNGVFILRVLYENGYTTVWERLILTRIRNRLWLKNPQFLPNNLVMARCQNLFEFEIFLERF